MAFEVFLTDDATRDMEDLYRYIAEHDGWERAEYVLEHIERSLGGLSEYPDRGAIPGELSELGIREYREILFKPYRIVYRVTHEAVYVYLIADGRRDMQSLLQRRLLMSE